VRRLGVSLSEGHLHEIEQRPVLNALVLAESVDLLPLPESDLPLLRLLSPLHFLSVSFYPLQHRFQSQPLSLLEGLHLSCNNALHFLSVLLSFLLLHLQSSLLAQMGFFVHPGLEVPLFLSFQLAVLLAETERVEVLLLQSLEPNQLLHLLTALGLDLLKRLQLVSNQNLAPLLSQLPVSLGLV
jgi:hypothetical protein